MNFISFHILLHDILLCFLVIYCNLLCICLLISIFFRTCIFAFSLYRKLKKCACNLLYLFVQEMIFQFFFTFLIFHPELLFTAVQLSLLLPVEYPTPPDSCESSLKYIRRIWSSIPDHLYMIKPLLSIVWVTCTALITADTDTQIILKRDCLFKIVYQWSRGTTLI